MRPVKSKYYNAFISYKSEDIQIVRRIAEQLMASAYQVWFAEYQILLQNYDLFQSALDKGLEASEFCICFTNDRYIQSPYCQYELEKFLSRNQDWQDRIIEILCPAEPKPHLKYPQLALCSSTEHFELNNTLNFVASRIRKPVILTGEVMTPKHTSIRVFDDGRERYALDVHGWDVDVRRILPASGGDIEGPKFVRRCGDYSMWGNLYVGDQVDNPRAWKSQVNDRECYKYAIDFGKHFYFKRWWWRIVERPVGLHLLFLHGYSHIGFSAKTWLNMWTRRYSVVLPNPRTRHFVEFAFIFFFRGPFEQFCRYIGLADDLVSSLQWA